MLEKISKLTDAQAQAYYNSVSRVVAVILFAMIAVAGFVFVWQWWKSLNLEVAEREQTERQKERERTEQIKAAYEALNNDKDAQIKQLKRENEILRQICEKTKVIDVPFAKKH